MRFDKLGESEAEGVWNMLLKEGVGSRKKWSGEIFSL